MTAESDRERGLQVQARLAAATAGPWSTDCGGTDDDWPVQDSNGDYLCTSPDDGVRGGHDRENADLIAHAPDDLRWALDVLARAERAEAALARFEAYAEMFLSKPVAQANAGDVAAASVGAGLKRTVRGEPVPVLDQWSAALTDPKATRQNPYARSADA